jgi:uncharacterized protein YkwD
MTRRGYVAHNSPDGRTPWDRCSDQGTTCQAENIAARGRAATADAFVTQFQNSNLHCLAMYDPRHRTFGPGFALNDNGRNPISTMTQKFSHRNPSTIADDRCVRGRSLSFNETEEEEYELMMVDPVFNEEEG